MRSPRLPNEGSRLADLDCAGRAVPIPAAMSSPAQGSTQAPQYSITIRDWKTGDEVASDDFGFKNATSAKKVDLKDLPDMDELPKIFAVGGTK